MSVYPFRQVDAFTRTPLAGNAAAVVFDAGDLSDAQMLAIAREMNLAETAFVMPSTVADFKVRFFTTVAEIPLAGHPTIATFHALAEAGRIPAAQATPDGRVRVTQELTVGVLPVEIDMADGQPQRVIMTQKPPQFLAVYDDRHPWADALGITTRDLFDTPLQIVSTGTPQMMIPVRSLDVLARLRPDLRRLLALHQAGDWFSLHVFTPHAQEPGHAAHARHFDPRDNVFEDPVTGSATGGMSCYLYRYGLVERSSFTCEQGHILGRPGYVDVELDGTPEHITGVRIAGPAVTVITGELIL
ncbi:MAG: PhzF family phenazine biosynthesis protein [Anaerolineae bacterium]|nr:PhzF family phenazine biosynthesis protein [Anaerolineae bacterium]